MAVYPASTQPSMPKVLYESPITKTDAFEGAPKSGMPPSVGVSKYLPNAESLKIPHHGARRAGNFSPAPVLLEAICRELSLHARDTRPLPREPDSPTSPH